MKRLLYIMIVLGIAAPLVAASNDVAVSAKDGMVKASPDHLSKTVEVVHYGDQMKVVIKEKGWVQVTTPSGKSGWIHESATTKKKIKLGSDQKFGDGSASHDEVALAGKGFNKTVEQSYAKNDPAVAQALQVVNQIEANRVTPTALQAFIKQGKLK